MLGWFAGYWTASGYRRYILAVVVIVTVVMTVDVVWHAIKKYGEPKR